MLLVYLLLVELLPAQPTLEWSKTFGGSNYEESEVIRQTTDGGFVVAGYTVSTDGDVFGNHGGADFWVLKLNAQGNVQWKKLFGGSQSDVPSDIQPLPDGGYYISGYTASNDHDVSGQHGEVDGWIIKISAQGALEWQKTLGGSKRDYFESVAVTPDQGCILAGHSKSSDGDVSENFGDIDFWVVKLDSTGALQWERSFGGSGQELANTVAVCVEGGYVVAGEVFSMDGHITEHHGNSDYWVIKLDNNGEIAWQKTYGGLNAESARDIKQTFDGGYVAIGMTGSVNSGQVQGNGDKGLIDYWVIKITATGELNWQRTLGGTNSDWGDAITQTADGGYVAAGAARSSDVDVSDTFIGQDMWLVKLSPDGELIWQKAVGGSTTDDCYSVITTTDGGLALAGHSWSSDGDLAAAGNRGKTDIWAVKLSPQTSQTASEELPDRMSIFPNPATAFVSIQLPDNTHTLDISIRDLSGKIVHKTRIEPGKPLNITSLKPGAYEIAASPIGTRMTYFGKLVVTR